MHRAAGGTGTPSRPSASPTVALSAEDRAILALECPTIVGHTCHVVVLEPGALGAAALRDRVQARLEAAPELRYRLAGTTEQPVWTPVDVDLAQHVSEPGGTPLDPAELRAFVAARFARHLDRSRPLWAIDVVPLTGGGSALVWRLHHALADGTTFVRLARTVLFDEAPPRGGTDATGPAVSTPAVIAQDHARRRAHLAGFLRREFALASGRSPFDGTVGTKRDVAFVDARLPELHAAARAAGGTVNDAVLSIVAGGLRRWIEHHAGPVTDVRVRVPVSLHQEGSLALNRDSWFSLPLPLHVTDPVARLRTVHRATDVRKQARDAARMHLLLDQLSGVAPPLQRWVERVQASPREFAVSVSNVIGTRQPVSVLGRPVSSIRSIAEIGQRHALRVSAMSTGDNLAFGCCVDPSLVEGVDVLADALSTEIDLLVEAVAP